ncbi:MAG: DUF2480 family protein [Rhodothermales bacterium]
MEPIANRVEESDIVVFNLEELWDEQPVAEIDIEPFLYEGMILREKDFRQKVSEHDWTQYRDHHVALYCSADAIVPTWAFMLIATKLDGIARSVAMGRRSDLVRDHFVRAIEHVDWSDYEGKPVVVKGCGSKLVPADAYLLAATKLQQVAAKLMYGEPCSSVPLWRRPVESPKPKAGATKPAIPPSLKQNA